MKIISNVKNDKKNTLHFAHFKAVIKLLRSSTTSVIFILRVLQ